MTIVAPSVPCLVVGTVSHSRRTPVRHAFEHSQYQWLVDLAALPQLRWPMRLLAGFDARDHLDGGRLGGGTRGDLERWLSRRGVVLDREDRVLMLAHARALGHVFNPLTVYWCVRPDQSLRALVLEVHNTYGERHAYLVDVDDGGRGALDKEFYVSPFNDTHGRYVVAVELRPDRFRASVGLDRGGERVLTAVTRGRMVPATTRTLLSAFGRHLFMTHRVSLLIRRHGIRLWLARLPVQPRAARQTEGAR